MLLTHIILFALMFTSIVFFESSSKKIILWGLIICFTSILGYLIYFIFFCDKGFVKKQFYIKEKEDKIYKNLVNFNPANTISNNSNIMNYAKRVYGANIYKNSRLQILNNNEEFNNSLMLDIDNAKKFIIIDTRLFCNSISQDMILSSLQEKAKTGIQVKVIYSKKTRKDKLFFKTLKESGARVVKFSKFSYTNGFYKNNKSIICVDGVVAYLYSQFSYNTNPKKPIEYLDKYYRLTGDIVKAINVEAHMDVTYATRKFYDYKELPTIAISNNTEFQYIGSSINNNLLGLILKAIIEAEKSIIIHVDKFIPNESILQAIKLAIKSNIEVKIMISNVNHIYGYYTSRSYVKELASIGAVCYYFDGHINSNYVVVDEKLVMIGTLSFVNQELVADLQDVLLINDDSITKDFINMFNSSILNSYKLCNPKRVLFREKFFRKFM